MSAVSAAFASAEFRYAVIMLSLYRIRLSPQNLDLIRECQAQSYFHPMPSQGGRKIFACTPAARQWVLRSGSGNPFSESLRHLLRTAEVSTMDSAEADGLRSRIIYSLESYLHDPPPAELLQELALYLHSRPQTVVEYLGRGKLPAPEVKTTLADSASSSDFMLDVPGGNRSYLWRADERTSRLSAELPARRFAEVQSWLADPSADVVLCLGGGGMRMLCLASFFKILDYLNVRDNIQAIWGCSMGAIVGYTYAIGLEPHKIEKIAYGVYNERYERAGVGSSTSQLLWGLVKRKLTNNAEEATGLSEIQANLIEILADAKADSASHLQTIPMLAVATNVTTRRVMGLALNHEPAANLDDFIIKCEPLLGLSASAAVPLLFHAQRITAANGQEELWLDGALGEEVPISLAYQAWRRRQQETRHPRRLKILYVDSGSEFSQVAFFARMEKFLKPLSNIALPWRLADVMYESRFHNLTRLIGDDPMVEIRGIHLDLMGVSSLDPLMIPHIIRQGRRAMIQGMDQINQDLAELTLRQRQDTSA